MTTAIVPSISDEQLAELERLCESAIPGPWFSDSCDGSLYVSPEPNGDTAVAIVLPNDWNDEEGFWFSGPLTLACHELIGAANPQALSALISRLRAAEADAKRYRKWTGMMFVEPSKLAMALAPCESVADIDAALDAMERKQ